MRKNILILVVSVVLFSLFNTSDANFRLWNTPSVNTDYIASPDVPISFNTDISVLGLVTNFFAKCKLDYSINIDIDYTLADDAAEEVIEEPIIEVVEEVIEEPIVEVVVEVVEAPAVIEEAEEVVEAPTVIEEVVEAPTVIEEAVEEPIVEVVEEAVEEPIVEVVEEVIEAPAVIEETEEVIEAPVVQENSSLPSNKEIIQQHPNIKESAKELILEALEDGDITMSNVFDLLNEYASEGKELSKQKVKQFIKKNRK